VAGVTGERRTKGTATGSSLRGGGNEEGAMGVRFCPLPETRSRRGGGAVKR
jgi:hypothetical protein